MNYAETSTYERELAKEGFEAVPWNKGADVFVVNTCTVTEHSDMDSSAPKVKNIMPTMTMTPPTISRAERHQQPRKPFAPGA